MAATALAISAGCSGSGGSGEPGGSRTTNAATQPAAATAGVLPRSNLPVATDLTTCINTLFSDLGAPAEHGGELEPAFVMHKGARHASPALPRLFDEATGGVLSANANQIDFRNSPVELYFFGSVRAAAAALPTARQELASVTPGRQSRIGTSGSVIYVEHGPVGADALQAISDCLREYGGRPIP
jgi:hypothetical protein